MKLRLTYPIYFLMILKKLYANIISFVARTGVRICPSKKMRFFWRFKASMKLKNVSKQSRSRAHTTQYKKWSIIRTILHIQNFSLR